MQAVERLKLKRELAIRKARKSLWSYCQVTDSAFYRRDRRYQALMANAIQDFIYQNDTDDVLILNMPPRFGKSRTLGKTCEWILGQDTSIKIMTGSYNETLSVTFSKGVRNTIQEESADADGIVYSDIFPDTRIREGDGAMNLWGLEGGHYNYLATSPSGTATGFGADILIIDDLIKSAKEAFTDRILKEHWEWFTQTMLSRLEGNGKIIICMTRWNVNDLSGRAERELEELGYSVKKIVMPVMDDKGNMLEPSILNYDQYQKKSKAIGPAVAEANYMQAPKSQRGKLYQEGFSTYAERPKRFEKVIAFTDPAAEGTDYLAHIVAGVYQGELYVIDIIYTQAGTETTIPMVTASLAEHDVKYWYPESNNAFTMFTSAVKKALRNEYKNYTTMAKPFAQTGNKRARIISSAHAVQNAVRFPEGWETRHAKFYTDLTTYSKDGKNEHDDAPDALTGLVEAHEGKYNAGFATSRKGW